MALQRQASAENLSEIKKEKRKQQKEAAARQDRGPSALTHNVIKHDWSHAMSVDEQQRGKDTDEVGVSKRRAAKGGECSSLLEDDGQTGCIQRPPTWTQRSDTSKMCSTTHPQSMCQTSLLYFMCPTMHCARTDRQTLFCSHTPALITLHILH